MLVTRWCRASCSLTILLFLTNLITPILAVNQATYNPPNSDVAIAINVPEPPDNNDLYFSLKSSVASQWVGFGFGEQMAGSLVFVVYGAADNKNVTISPRLATGHVMPEFTRPVGITILSGSAIVEGGGYVANFRCTNCWSWSMGEGKMETIDLTAGDQPMIYAIGPAGDPILSDNPAETITQHQTHDQFQVSLRDATGPGGVPTVALTGDDNGFGPPGFGDGDNGDDDPASIGRRVHAAFMIGAFLVGFPLGYLLLRVLERTAVHALIQSLAAFAVLLGMGSGIALSIRSDISPHINAGHQIFGLLIVALVLATWTLGFLGHRIYRKTQTPSIPTKIHRFAGPATIFLGLANGIYGFHFAGNNGGIIGLVILTAIMVLGVGSVVFLSSRRRLRRGAMNTPAAQNFRAGQAEYAGPPGQYGGGAAYTGFYGNGAGAGRQESGTGPAEGVPLQPYSSHPASPERGGGGGQRPMPYTLPSYHSDAGRGEEPGAPPRYA